MSQISLPTGLPPSRRTLDPQVDSADCRWSAGDGRTITVTSHLPGLTAALRDRLGVDGAAATAPAVGGIVGELRPFDSDRLLRRLPAGARRVGFDGNDLIDVYRDPAGGAGGEGKFWTVDESWGLCELDLPRGRWTAWVLPHVAGGGAVGSIDAAAVIDSAVIRPAAHLLAGRGTHLIPAASVEVHGRGILIVGPSGPWTVGDRSSIGPATRSTRRGLRMLSRGWTAVREEAGTFVLDGLPDAANGVSSHATPTGWCDAVVLVDPGRHGSAGLAEVPGESAVAACRSAWPMPGLISQRHGARFAARLARRCRVWRARLTGDPSDLPRMLEAVTAAAYRPLAPTRPEGLAA